MKIFRNYLLPALAFAMVTAASLAADNAQRSEKNEYIVKYKNDQPYFIQGHLGIQITDAHEAGNLLKISINSDQQTQSLAYLLANPEIEYVVENFKLKALTASVDTQALKEQWAIKKVRAEEAWKTADNTGSKTVIVAVIDTGVDYNHESLKPNMVKGYDFKDNDDNPMDDVGKANPGHGTHCAGILGATGLVDGGIIGLSPEVSMMPIRFLGADGSGDLMAGIKSVDYAIEKGAKVISASWGANVPRAQAQPLIDAVKRANDAGVIFVMAAGNDGKNNDSRPTFPANANFENTITVAASNATDAKPSWSNFGRATVDLSAPGDAIMSTLPGNKYQNLSGTSMATPLVAGLVALLKAQDESLTGAQAKAIMQITGAKVSIETACDCRIDAASSVDTLVNKKMYLVPAASTLTKDSTQQFTAINADGAVNYTSSAADVATIDESGLLKPLKEGKTTITAKDSSGNVAQSLDIFIGKSGSDGGGGTPPPGEMPPGLDRCPFENELLCQGLCAIMPELPFCSQ